MGATGDALEVETPDLVLMKTPQELLSIWAQLLMRLELGTPGAMLITGHLLIVFKNMNICLQHHHIWKSRWCQQESP